MSWCFDKDFYNIHTYFKYIFESSVFQFKKCINYATHVTLKKEFSNVKWLLCTLGRLVIDREGLVWWGGEEII